MYQNYLQSWMSVRCTLEESLPVFNDFGSQCSVLIVSNYFNLWIPSLKKEWKVILNWEAKLTSAGVFCFPYTWFCVLKVTKYYSLNRNNLKTTVWYHLMHKMEAEYLKTYVFYWIAHSCKLNCSYPYKNWTLNVILFFIK